MAVSKTLVNLPVRGGAQPAVRRPSAERPGPHQQLSQNAPLELQEALFALGRSLPGVTTGRSLVSLPGARAFFLDPNLAHGPDAAFQAGTEFAHIHAPFDGSLHVTLPEQVAREVIVCGWGEPHPLQKGLLIFGPRDEPELAVAWQLLRVSHLFACGTWMADEPAMQERLS
jgi:phospholipase/carboxylesterase